MLNYLFGKRSARKKWEAELTWFRLRYWEESSTTHALHLLSRAQACSRLALLFFSGNEVSQLYLGVPEIYTRLLHQMAADFRFSLKPKPAEVLIPPAQRLKAAAALPWDQAFVAHIVDEKAFVSLLDCQNKGSFFPQRTIDDRGHASCRSWQLPASPPPGLSLRPAWEVGQRRRAAGVGAEKEVALWPLGQTLDGSTQYMSGRINIYGKQKASAAWLVELATQLLATNQGNLVIIDGAGDLVPTLKRKAAVTRLLGDHLTYLDLDSPALVAGLNPLAAAPGEGSAQLVQRWQQWFQGMYVHPQSLPLLSEAHQSGVGDIPALRHWLKKKERQGKQTAVASLGMVLDRLMASRSMRTWLEWPTDPYRMLPEGCLFFACRGTDWARQHVLRAVLLAVLHTENLRIIVHGVSWKGLALTGVDWPAQMIISNGPLLPEALVLLVETPADKVSLLANRFLQGNSLLAENLALLRHGEGICIQKDHIYPVSWHTNNTKDRMTRRDLPGI